jgi:general secretion pathway protein D
MILKTFFRKICLRYAAIFLTTWIAAGCSEPYIVKPITLPRDAVTSQNQEASADADSKVPAYEEIKQPQREKIKVDKKLPPPEAPREAFDPKRIVLKEGTVMINAEKMPLSDFVIYALGETLKISFIMDDKTMNDRQPVTLRMPRPLPAVEALEIVTGFLEKTGLLIEERAGALYILQKPAPPALAAPVDVRIGYNPPDSSATILQVVPLKHIRYTEINPLIADMFKTNITIKSYKDNVLLLYGKAGQLKPIIEFIEIFDVPYLQDKRIFLLHLTYWQVDEFVTQISRILQGIGFTIATAPNSPGIMFMPIKQLSSVLVISPDENSSKYILEWKEKLDTTAAAGTGEKSYTYSPLYSRASQLVESINHLYGITSAAPATAKPPTTTGGAGATAALSQSGMRIAADDNKNIILIVSSPATYKQILELLRGLDVPAKQVLIEATIAELTLTDDLRYGVEWYIKDSQSGGQYALGTLGKLGLSSVGLSYAFLSQTGNFQALVAARATANKANILSTPRLTVMDNKEATIQVGQDVPIVTGQVTASDITSTVATPSILQNIQYRTTGVILKVKPTINTEGLLTLDISQEVSEVGAPGAGNSPIILTRRINTSVIVGHGQTLALGGLMKDNNSSAITKVPLLGDIPLLGNLFKYTAITKEKTELLVLVTPTILTGIDDGTQITNQMKKELKWLK